MRRTKCLAYFVVLQTTVFLLLATLNNYSYSNIYVKKHSIIDGFSCDSAQDISVNKSRVIPKHIHQMFFYMTDKTLPEKMNSGRKTWENNHYGFKYTLWNASMVEELLEERYPQLRDLYHSYGHWVRRADMARYIVLYEYGGIYVDLDIKSTGKHLNELYQTFNSTTDIVLYL
jgi:mannosyltransferase OCH1-like enzyme